MVNGLFGEQEFKSGARVEPEDADIIDGGFLAGDQIERAADPSPVIFNADKILVFGILRFSDQNLSHAETDLDMQRTVLGELFRPTDRKIALINIDERV
jgi:hypothetical protein